MAKSPASFDASGDSEDLQALFDSIASSAPPPAPEAAAITEVGDSDELQALFDTVVAQQGTPEPAAAHMSGGDRSESAMFNRIGLLARQLHENLRELGYDRLLEDTARQMPDARQRLQYIAQMTEQAASRVLNATDIAQPLQDELLAGTQALASRWELMFSNRLSVDDFKSLAADSRAYFQAAPAKITRTSEQLQEIMMAQDFQDLTGQVIKKVVEMAQGLETQLLNVLIEVMPEERKADVPEGLLNGPVTNAAGRDDVVTTQAQVDDLLESLGF